MRYLTPLFVFCLMAVTALSSQAAAPITLAVAGKSTYSIVIPKSSPASVQAAAKELQRDIADATGAKLSLLQDDANITGNFISLGETSQAAKADISARAVALEGFRIITKNGNVYIIGPDTPDGEFTSEGGTSNGTANGVYTFLEDYVNVRWLLPGDLGRDVPKQNVLQIQDIDRTEAPVFLNRREPYIQNNRPAVGEWEAHQKLGFSFSINHGHNWTKTITPDLYKSHPDWFAMIKGKRPVPSGQYKLETTNHDMVRYFASRAIERLKANPHANTFSLSPSDGRGWSQSPASEALYDPVPLGDNFPGTSSLSPSVTPLVLKFYRDVSQIVAKEYPQGKLAGYLYNEYLFPPVKGDMTLPDNFYPVVASSLTYGYTLYRKDVQQYYSDLMADWSKVTPHLFYYDLPNNVSPSSGIVLPAAPEILNTIFPTLVKNHVKGLYIYGTESWNNSAMANYILAKMMWNPQLNAYDLQREWLRRAYGAQAGATMETFYTKLDSYFRDYYQTHEKARYHLTDEQLQAVYVPHYGELEKLFLQAKAQPMTSKQQQRLQMIEDNWVVLQWRLRNMKNGLPADFSSTLKRDNNTVNELLFRPNADFDLFPGLVEDGPKPPAVNVKIAAPLDVKIAAHSLPLRGENQALLYAAQDGTVRIISLPIKHGSSSLSYVLKDHTGHIVTAGAVALGKTLTFDVKGGTPYFFYIPRGIYNLSIEGAAVAYRTDITKTKQLHLFSNPATLYVYVPAGTPNRNLLLSSSVPGETAKATIYAPDGTRAGELKTETEPTQQMTLKGQAGFWKIEIDKAETGILDDVFLTFDKKLPQWVSVDPTQPLMVLPAK